MNSVQSSFSHDLSPLFLFPHFPFSLSIFPFPFCSTFIPVTISIPHIFIFIPHISPILSLTFYYSLSSIRLSLTLHSSLFFYPFLVISYSSPSSPIPVPVRLHNSKEGLREKLTSRTNPHLERIF